MSIIERLKELVEKLGAERATEILNEIKQTRQLSQGYVHTTLSMTNDELLFRYMLVDAISNLGFCTVERILFVPQYKLVKVVTLSENYSPKNIIGYLVRSSHGDCILIRGKYIANFMTTCGITQLDMLKLEDGKLIIGDLPEDVEVDCYYELVYHEDGYTPFMVRKPGAPENSRNPKDYVQKRQIKPEYSTLR